MGSLKPVIANAGSAKNTTMSVGETPSFAVDMSNVKKLVRGDTVSYSIALRPKTPRAVHFENITIQTIGDKTTAFLTTYLPTKEWIADWRGQKHLPFKGEIYASRINLADLPSLNEQGTAKGSQDKVMDVNTSQVLINNNKISLLPGECEIYDVYEVIPYPCKYGHWNGDERCTYSGDPSNKPGDEDWPAGYRIERTSVVNCAPPSFPSTGGGEGGGGGGTTPNPPGDYDPCDGGTPTPVTVSRANGSGFLKLAGVPPSDCDENPLPPPPPVYPLQVQSLISMFNLSGTSLDYVVNNQATAIELYEALEEEGFSYEGKIATEMTIKAGGAGVFGMTDVNAHYNAIASSLPNSNIVDPQTLGVYFTMQCVMVEIEHPTYPKWRVYWEASKEMVHLMLDGIGLIPGAGEIADLSNGLIYTIEGDGVNAGLSYASAIPFVGWFSTGAKFAKKTINLTNGTKTTLKWARKAGNLVNFGDRRQLRTVLKLLKGDLRQAHHIIPWAKQTHPAIQKAAKRSGSSPFHMNDALNGIPLDESVHLGSHAHYDNLVQIRLDQIPNNATPEQAYDKILDIISDIRTAVQNNPGVPINQLIF